MTRLHLAAAWLRAWRKARVPGLRRDGRELTRDEDRALSRIALLYYLTALDPRTSPRGRKR